MSILTKIYFCNMQLIKRIRDFYIFSNIHVAIAGFCITQITVIKYEINSSLVPMFVALSIVFSYNFIRYYELKTNRLLWLKDWFNQNRKPLFVLNVISIISFIAITFFTSFNIKGLYIVIPFVFMTFFYVIPIAKFNGVEISFRNFPAIKIFSIAFSWAGVSLLLPLAEAGVMFNSDIYLEFIQRVALLIAIIIPFDIRDVKIDDQLLQTLPQILGIKWSKIIGFSLLLVTVLIELFKQYFQYINLLTWLLVTFITGLFLWFTSEKRGKFYVSFWVESIPIFWFLIVYFLKIFNTHH